MWKWRACASTSLPLTFWEGGQGGRALSPHKVLVILDRFICQKTERPISAKAAGTGLRAGHGAPVTSLPEQVRWGWGEEGSGMVSNSRSQPLTQGLLSHAPHRVAGDPGTRAVSLRSPYNAVMEIWGWARSGWHIDLCSNSDNVEFWLCGRGQFT